jgi:general secretion pathway protein M
MNKPSLGTLRARLQHLRVQIHAWWQPLVKREKLMVIGMGVFVSAALIFWLGISPALHKIDYWAGETPKLRSQSQTLERLLKAAGIEASPGADGLEQRLRRSLDERGLKDRYQLQAPAEQTPGVWQLSFESAPADAALGWLLDAPQRWALKVEYTRLQRVGVDAGTETTGTLSGTVRMDYAPGAKEAS